MKLVLQNVTIVNADGREVGDIFVDGGKIVGEFEGGREIDGSGKFLLPGLIDAHVHFREPGDPHKETWETGSAAAAMGGVTTVLDMPNTDPATISVQRLQEKKALVAGRSYVNYGFHFGATAKLEELEKVEGVTGVKVYMGSSTGDLLVDEPSLWEKIFQIAKNKDIPVIVHAENEERIKERMHEIDQKDAKSHAEIRDCECARISVEAAVSLQEKVGNRLHLAHVSTSEEIDLLKEHKNELLSAEVTPHHLFFTKDEIVDSFLKMNPPLREKDDQEALWMALESDLIDCVATDHAPHTIEEKSPEKGWGPSGVPGIEFALPLLLNSGKMTLEQIASKMSSEPARIFRLSGKGDLQLGMDADLVLIDLEMEQEIRREDVISKCGWSPYEGMKLKGWPIMTIVNGEIVMEAREIVGGKVGKGL